MLKWTLRIGLVLAVVLGAAFWWLLLDAGAPKTAEGEFDLATYRSLVADDTAATLPRAIRIETVGTDHVATFATEAGWFDGTRPLAYSALQVIFPDSTIVIGAATDEETFAVIAQSDEATFDAPAYERLTRAIQEADQVLITHEHPDHVVAIVRHPNPESIAPRLRLNADQLLALPHYAPGGVLAPAIAAISPFVLDNPVRIAPGLVAAPTPGHSKGTITFYVRQQNGNEYLLIGDIVWMMHNIEALKSRPRLLEVAFGIGEDREAVQRQVRGLHDLQATEPDLIIVPNHDGDYLDELIRDSKLTAGFSVRE